MSQLYICCSHVLPHNKEVLGSILMDEVIEPLLVVSDDNELGLRRIWLNPNTIRLNVGPTSLGLVLY